LKRAIFLVESGKWKIDSGELLKIHFLTTMFYEKSFAPNVP
jgi:hypothetical protein